MAEDFLSQFCVRGDYAIEVLDTLASQLLVGIKCSKMWTHFSGTLASKMEKFRRERYHEYRKQYQLIDPASCEVFCFHHGLRELPAPLRNRMRTRSIIDVGAFNGDLALALSSYAKDVYSIEMPAENVQTMRRILAADANYSSNVHIVHAGVWSESVNATGPRGGAAADFTRFRAGLNWTSLPSTTSCRAGG
jgi:hypothetical protein